MATFFKTDRLKTGAKDVDSIFEMADSLGLDVIKLTGKQIGHSTSAVFGFDVPVGGFNYQTRTNETVIDRGYVYFYPDNNGTKWGFCIDTEHNRAVIASHYAAPEFQPADQRVKREIEELCLKLGFGIVPVSEANPYIQKSESLKRDEHKRDELAMELAILERKRALLMEDLEKADYHVAQKEAYHGELHPPVVEQVTVDPLGNQVIEQVKAITPERAAKPKAQRAAARRSKLSK